MVYHSPSRFELFNGVIVDFLYAGQTSNIGFDLVLLAGIKTHICLFHANITDAFIQNHIGQSLEILPITWGLLENILVSANA